jgi:hypothetical protein
MPHILVHGIVSHRDRQPYLQMDVDGRLVQLSMSQARQVAQDLTTMCARTEADAMLMKFFSNMDLPMEACAAMLQQFRDFRQELDLEKVERTSGEGT